MGARRHRPSTTSTAAPMGTNVPVASRSKRTSCARVARQPSLVTTTSWLVPLGAENVDGGGPWANSRTNDRGSIMDPHARTSPPWAAHTHARWPSMASCRVVACAGILLQNDVTGPERERPRCRRDAHRGTGTRHAPLGNARRGRALHRRGVGTLQRVSAARSDTAREDSCERPPSIAACNLVNLLCGGIFA